MTGDAQSDTTYTNSNQNLTQLLAELGSFYTQYQNALPCTYTYTITTTCANNIVPYHPNDNNGNNNNPALKSVIVFTQIGSTICIDPNSVLNSLLQALGNNYNQYQNQIQITPSTNPNAACQYTFTITSNQCSAIYTALTVTAPAGFTAVTTTPR
uniref:Uncharacterized protein n=1 Tax=Acrobeloides nanus TaxID=290746 RepID=A0A914ERP4_9BILA